MQKYTFGLILFFLTAPLLETYSQNNLSVFKHYYDFCSDDSSKLFLRLENFNFIKNNEYKSDFAEGATWIGHLLSPQIVYYPAHNIRVSAGVRLQKFSGRTRFSESTPYFSIHYQPTPNSALIVGKLNQNNNHGLSEPLFEPEQFYTSPAENGLQLLTGNGRGNLDTWINWEQTIFEGDPFQERFSFGISGEYQLNQKQSTNRLLLPLHMLATHRGGEIDSSDAPVQTLFNIASGLRLQKNISSKIIKSLEIEALAYIYKDNSSNTELPFSKGHAIYPAININTTYGLVNWGYWNGYNFAAPKGSLLFQSWSQEGIIKSRRELITIKYNYNKEISKGIELGGKIDWYIDVRNNTQDFATAIYLLINQNYFLKKIQASP